MGRTFVLFCVKTFQICRALWALGLAHGVSLCITLLSHAVCNPRVGKGSTAASLLLWGSVFEMHQTTLLASCVFCVCSWESDTMVLSSICRVLCLQVKSWAQGDLPAGIFSGVTAQVTQTAVWSFIHWDSWGACLLGRQKAMKPDLGNLSSAVFVYDICHRLEKSIEIFQPLGTARSSQPCCQDSYLTTW